MNIERSAAGELTIHGNIKSIDDYTAIKNQITGVIGTGNHDLTLRIPESFSLPSSVIGYLLKLKNRDNVRIRMTIGDRRLHELLSDLNLLGEFGVTLTS